MLQQAAETVAESVLSVASAEALLSVEGSSSSSRMDKKTQLASLVNSLSLNDAPNSISTNLHRILGSNESTSSFMMDTSRVCPSTAIDEEKNDNEESNILGIENDTSGGSIGTRRSRCPASSTNEGKRDLRPAMSSQPMSVSVPNLTSTDSEPLAQSLLETFAAVTGRRLAGGSNASSNTTSAGNLITGTITSNSNTSNSAHISSNVDSCVMGLGSHTITETGTGGVGSNLWCGGQQHHQLQHQTTAPKSQQIQQMQQPPQQQSVVRGAIPSLSGGSLFPASATHSVSSLVRLALSSHFHFPG